MAPQSGGLAGPRPEAVDLGTRRELFLDDFLVEKLSGKAERRLHHPVPQNLCLTFDEPWEGNVSGSYASVFPDGARYRMYYTTYQTDPVSESNHGKVTPPHPLYTCYAESDDGVLWRKPDLGLHEFRGSKHNNIVLVTETIGDYNVNAGHTAVFKDENPAAPPDARYKAFIRIDVLRPERHYPTGLLALKSADGLHWVRMADKPVITFGAFDSQNLGFWDSASGQYRAYWRYDTAGTTNDTTWDPAGFRAVRTATSKDFIHWSAPENLRYGDSTEEHLYTNQIKPYYRAPHLLIGFPTRYIERDSPDAMEVLPDPANRKNRAAGKKRFGTALTDGLIMTSRDGVTFQRWSEAFLRPGIERPNTWAYGDHYLAWHVIETRSALEGAPAELSLFATEAYWIGTSSALRRYTLRLDGFASVQAPMAGGELVTKPVRFRGSKLSLNFSTSAAGRVRVELQGLDGKALAGFALSDCAELFGDSVDRKVTWTSGSELVRLAGQPVRLRFEMRDADVFSFQFQE
jgi:hypothetical protein